MTRREVMKAAATTALARSFSADAAEDPSATSPSPLRGTEFLAGNGDLAHEMMEGAHRFIEAKIAESPLLRPRYWSRDISSVEAYNQSVEPNRQRLRTIIGAADARLPASMERFGDDDNPALVAESVPYRIHQIRWPVLPDIWGEGLLLETDQPLKAYVVAIPDADITPEQLSGLAAGLPPDQQFARRLAENGFTVIVPVLLDRTAEWSGHPEIRMSGQSHREWIYRQAFLMGRHVIGFEVQKVLSVVDWIRQRSNTAQIGVAGHGEGGLIAFYSSALDTRIQATLVSGYFNSRQNVWTEPIYRNVWGLLNEFGDAELATLIAPRGLVIEHSPVLPVANQNGALKTPQFATVQQEFRRIDLLIPASFGQRHLVRAGADQTIGPWSQNASDVFARLLNVQAPLLAVSDQALHDRRLSFSPRDRQRRQVAAIEDHVQAMLNDSERVRQNFFLYKVMPELADETWTKKLRFDPLPPKRLTSQTDLYRRYLWEQVLGKFDNPLLPLNARSRQIYNREKWTGYDVVLDVWPDVFAWGILLLPKDLKPGERRPVVVCQHGRNGVPRNTVEGDDEFYRNFAARLAEQGFITFAPHNLYRHEEGYRWLSRKANGVKASLFSFIIGQHAQILRWLKTLPMVDATRIGFYGLSYGGETAVRVPAILEDYALSISSGDFNSWVQKVASTHQRFSFMYTDEWEMPYFNLGNTFDYAEMAYLMIPRPFMVERGHHDQVGRDQWVSYEYAKVRWLYAQLGLSDKTEIEYFNGGHTINGEGTFRFLHKHLNWPER